MEDMEKRLAQQESEASFCTFLCVHQQTIDAVRKTLPDDDTLLDVSELFKVLTNIQDEVHRYAITFHRYKRSKSALHSELDDIKGIGTKTKETLLRKFKSVKRIKTAKFDELAEVVGEAKARILTEHYNSTANNT